MDNDSDASYSQPSGRGGDPRKRTRRTTFLLGEDPTPSEQTEFQRLITSVEEAARRVVQDNSQGARGAPTGSYGSNTPRRHGTSTPGRYGNSTPGRHGASTPLGSGPHRSAPILGVKGDEYFEAPSPLGGEIGMVNIRRPVYSQSNFEKIWEDQHAEDQIKPNFFEKVQRIDKPKSCVAFIYRIFPLIAVIRNYSIKKNLFFDLVSGITTGVMRIPQSMAYSLLAQLPPSFGLFTAFFSAVLYSVFGGSHHMAAGAQGVVSLMVGAGVERAMGNSEFSNMSRDMTNTSVFVDPTNDPYMIEVLKVTGSITLLVGLIQALLGIFRLGFITNYLSDPLIGGFTTGAACHVVVSQLSIVLGIKAHSFSGNFNMLYSAVDIFSKLDHVNVVTLLISLFSFVFLAIIKFLNFRFKTHLKIPIPGELIVLIMTIGFSYLFNIHHRWHVKVVGNVPSGFLTPQQPDIKYMTETYDIAFPTAIVSFAIGYSIAKRLALRNDYELDGNQEIFAFGFMNGVSSFFGCFASTASMSASSLHESLGGKTQIANLFASVLVLLTILFLGQIFEPAPECVLSCIILINLKSILSQFTDLKPLWIVSKIDFLLWVVSWIAVVILDVDIGLGIGVAFSLLTIVFRTQWPYSCILGRIPSTDIYKNRAITPNADEVPGIKIVRFEGALYFASAEHFRNSIYDDTECNPVKIAKRQQELQQKLHVFKRQVRSTLIRNGSSMFDTTENDEEGLVSSLGSEDRLLALEKSYIHTVILDCSACSFIDSVGIRTLSQVVTDYRDVHIRVYLANVRAAVRAMLLNTEAFSNKNIFLSVHDAVLMALENAQQTEERDFLIMDAGIKSVTRQVSMQVSRIHSDIE